MTSTADFSSFRMPRKRVRLLDAWRAVQALINDKEDTSQVFRVIDALGGTAEGKNFIRFASLPTGAAILREERSLLETLSNVGYLRSLPPESLGRHYLAFMQGENLTADGLVEASQDGPDLSALPPAARLFGNRMRDMHDLWHVTTGYGRDGLGELSLLAFTYAQGHNRGIGAIVLFGMRSLSSDHPGTGVWRAVLEGHRLGRKAQWMPAADWEHLLTRPLAEVRQTLGLTPPVQYQATLARISQAA
ncbi:MAG: Coq4 family protein [Parvibaculaceae bacterium]|nr:Coq4 family protein [Parvibaculaceae bacterium]